MEELVLEKKGEKLFKNSHVYITKYKITDLCFFFQKKKDKRSLIILL